MPPSTMSDALPYRPEDIARQAIDAAEAGAAVLHLHARHPETGAVSTDPDHFAAFLPAIRASTNAVVNLSTGGSLKHTVAERLAPAQLFSPEMCSLNMGSMNFSMHPLAERYKQWKFDWEEPYLRESDSYILVLQTSVWVTLASSKTNYMTFDSPFNTHPLGMELTTQRASVALPRKAR